MKYLLSHAVDHSAQRTPDQVAFRCRNEHISYAQLARRSNQLAHLLVEQSVERGDRVGILMPRCLESAVAVYGIMKSGAAFVPINPGLPVAAQVALVNNCGLRHIVATDIPHADVREQLDSVIGPASTGDVEDIISWDACSQLAGDAPPDVRITERDLAYIMYTSGSTGQPKGIMHTHRSGLSYAELSVETYDVRPEDRIANHSPLHFDMSTFGYFAGPLAGATTVIVPEEYTKLPASLARLMEDEQITIWYSVPASLIQLLTRGAIDQRDLKSLRWVKFGGEPFPLKHLHLLMRAWPHATFSNVYGPAEVNQCTWYHATDADAEGGQPLPIGRVWPNTDGLVLNEDDCPVDDGTTGELMIRSATMMLGYWNEPELTRRSFFRDANAETDRVYYRTGDLVFRNEDGNYVFQGRRDRQIKSRGHRVEMDDVEAALVACPKVIESAVWPVDDGEGSRVIAAAVVVAVNSQLSEADIAAFVKTRLPSYAVPVSIAVRRDFPRTATGKTDRRALHQAVQTEAGKFNEQSVGGQHEESA